MAGHNSKWFYITRRPRTGAFDDLLNELIDAIFIAALAIAGGGDLAPETFGVSAIIGALIGGWEVWKIIECIEGLKKFGAQRTLQ